MNKRVPPTVQSVLLLAGGSACLVISAVLMYAHALVILEIRDGAVPLVGQLSQLERRLAILEEQQELTELHAATRVGSPQEKVSVYSLPEGTNTARLLAVFEVVREVLSRDGLLAQMSSVEFGEAWKSGDVHTQPVSVQFDVHTDGLKTILLLVRLAGLLTVGDVLSAENIEQLTQRVEEENPAGIVSLEQFLSVSLPDYAENQRLYEENLRRSFSSASFMSTLESVTRTSLLADASVYLRSDIGKILQSYQLWPLQFMSVEHVTIQPGGAPEWHKLSLKLAVYSRPK